MDWKDTFAEITNVIKNKVYSRVFWQFLLNMHCHTPSAEIKSSIVMSI